MKNLVVQVLGRCHPTDCDWGTVEAKPFGANVQSSADAPINSVVATFSAGFAEKRLSLRLTTRDTLTSVVDTHFTDRSGRRDYENRSYERGHLREFRNKYRIRLAAGIWLVGEGTASLAGRFYVRPEPV